MPDLAQQIRDRLAFAIYAFGWLLAAWYCGAAIGARIQGTPDADTNTALFLAVLALTMHLRPKPKDDSEVPR